MKKKQQVKSKGREDHMTTAICLNMMFSFLKDTRLDNKQKIRLVEFTAGLYRRPDLWKALLSSTEKQGD